MAKVTRHQKSARGSFNCASCRKPLTKGDQYFMWSLKSGRGGILFRQHVSCGQPRRSQLTLGKMAGVYKAIENCEQEVMAAGYASDIEDAVQTCITELESVASDYTDALESMSQGLQESAAGATIQEKIDAINDLIDTLNEIDTDPDPVPSGAASAETMAEVWNALDGFSL